MGASICCTCALVQIQLENPALLRATSLNNMALNAFKLWRRDSTQALLHLHSGHWNVEQLQGWAPPNPHLPLIWYPWKCRVGRKSKNQPGVATQQVKHCGVVALLHWVIPTGNKRQSLKTKTKVWIRRPLSSALKRRQQCALTQDFQSEAVKYVRKQASPCSPWENSRDRHSCTHRAKHPIAQPCNTILTGFHMVGVMKGLIAKPSHQQGPPLLQALARSPYPQTQPQSPDSHSCWSWYVGKQNSPASQWPHTAELCSAERGSGACNSQHSLWPVLLVANAHIKVPEKPLYQCLPNPRPQSAQVPKILLFFPCNLQLQAFIRDLNMQIPR